MQIIVSTANVVRVYECDHTHNNHIKAVPHAWISQSPTRFPGCTHSHTRRPPPWKARQSAIIETGVNQVRLCHYCSLYSQARRPIGDHSCYPFSTESHYRQRWGLLGIHRIWDEISVAPIICLIQGSYNVVLLTLLSDKTTRSIVPDTISPAISPPLCLHQSDAPG